MADICVVTLAQDDFRLTFKKKKKHVRSVHEGNGLCLKTVFAERCIVDLAIYLKQNKLYVYFMPDF